MSDTSPIQEKASHDALIGRIISGRYEILELIGEGGSGYVFKARHVTLLKTVAVKILSSLASSDPEILKRLEIEARTCAILHHPGLVPVIDMGFEDDGTSFIAMEYVEGETLESLLTKEQFLSPPRVLSLARRVTEALAFAHRNGIIHRDIKPANIIVCSDDNGEETIKIVDFGIARADLSVGEMQRLTQSGQVFGSPSYMSPEQVRGEKVDSRTDIYSLGCVLYEVLTGKKAFRGDNMMTTMTLHLESQPKSLQLVREELNKWRDLELVVMRCLAKEKEKRFSSMQELSDSLESCELRHGVGKKHRGISVASPITKVLGTGCLAAVASAFFLGQMTKPVAKSDDGVRIKDSGYVGVYAPEKLATSILRQDRANKYVLLLAQAASLCDTGRIASAYKMYTTAFYEAQRNDEPDDVRIAIAMFATVCARDPSINDLPGTTMILKSLKRELTALLDDKSRRGPENIVAAEVIYDYASLIVESYDKDKLPGGKQTLREAMNNMQTAIDLAQRVENADSQSLINRIKHKMLRTKAKMQ